MLVVVVVVPGVRGTSRGGERSMVVVRAVDVLLLLARRLLGARREAAADHQRAPEQQDARHGRDDFGVEAGHALAKVFQRNGLWP